MSGSPTRQNSSKCAPISAKLSNLSLERHVTNLNVIFVGHVDAGKSTVGGHVLLLTDQVDRRKVERYKTEARGMGRESWYLSWVLDENEEERARGKTWEVGRKFFRTENRLIALLKFFSIICHARFY